MDTQTQLLTAKEFLEQNKSIFTNDTQIVFSEWQQQITPFIQKAVVKLLNAEEALKAIQAQDQPFVKEKKGSYSVVIEGNSIKFSWVDNLLSKINHETDLAKTLLILQEAASEAHAINVLIRAAFSEGGFMYKVGTQTKEGVFSTQMSVLELLDYSFLSVTVNQAGNLTTKLSLDATRLHQDIVSRNSSLGISTATDSEDPLEIQDLEERSTVWSATVQAVRQIEQWAQTGKYGTQKIKSRLYNGHIIDGRTYEVYNQIQQSIGGNRKWKYNNNLNVFARSIIPLVEEVLSDFSNTYYQGDTVTEEGTIIEEKFANKWSVLGLTSIHNIRSMLLTILYKLKWNPSQAEAALNKLFNKSSLSAFESALKEDSQKVLNNLDRYLDEAGKTAFK